MQTLPALLDELESKLHFKDAASVQVSDREVAWHIAHSLKVTYKIVAVLENSDPGQYRWKFNRARSFVFTFNHIPRGRGKAPQSVLPGENISSQEFALEFQKARQAIMTLENLAPKNFFTHPYFGMLNLKRSKKFIALHTQHHLKIIDDILKQTS